MITLRSLAAVRACTWLAVNHEGHTSDLATSARVHVNTMADIIRDLRAANIISPSGLNGHGGLFLGRPPREITLLDIARAVENMPDIRHGDPAHHLTSTITEALRHTNLAATVAQEGRHAA